MLKGWLRLSRFNPWYTQALELAPYGGSGLIDRVVLVLTESSCPDWLVSRGVNGGLLPLMSSVMGVLLCLYSSLTHPRLLNGLVTCVPPPP